MTTDYKAILQSRGIDTTDMTDDELASLIKSAELEITARTGILLHETEYTQVEPLKNTYTLLFDYYPIVSISNISIDDTELITSKITVDNTAGILYLHDTHSGMLTAKYTAGLTADEYEALVIPIILDMLEYNLSTGWDKNASSLKEGNVSVNLDTSVGLGAIINSSLENLKLRYNCLSRMI